MVREEHDLKLATFNPAFKDKVRWLARALAELDRTTSDRGRRLSRARVIRRLAGIRDAMDITYPAPAKKPVERTHRSPKQRLQRLLSTGWVEVGIDKVSMAAQAGVRARKVVATLPRWQGDKIVGDETETALLLPEWAAKAPTVAAMRALKAARGNTRKGMLIDIAFKKRAATKTTEVQF